MSFASPLPAIFPLLLNSHSYGCVSLFNFHWECHVVLKNSVNMEDSQLGIVQFMDTITQDIVQLISSAGFVDIFLFFYLTLFS